MRPNFMPSFVQVLTLQHQLLALQQKEVEELEVQV